MWLYNLPSPAKHVRIGKLFSHQLPNTTNCVLEADSSFYGFEVPFFILCIQDITTLALLTLTPLPDIPLY